MKAKFSPLILLVFVSVITFGQAIKKNLYMPLEFKKAYTKGTRKSDGTVSDTYWQNKAQYKIKATIDPHKKLLKGSADITYFNNSPDTLKNIVFHSYYDYYKLGSIRTYALSVYKDLAVITKGMEVQELRVKGDIIDLKSSNIRREATFYDISLQSPLAPKNSILLNIKWEIEIPGTGFRRTGASDSTSMFIAYWYPEIAVYDDIDGWDKTVYNGGTEFYHDFNDYEVEITTPNTFLVWASVQAHNEKEVLPEKIYSRLTQARLSDKPTSVVSQEDIGKWKLKSSVWKFNATNFPDFAFALSDHYVWDACRYKDGYGEFQVNSAYDPNHKSFSSVIKNQTTALNLFHTRFPQIKFPFNHFTIFNGESGMEFPGMAHDWAITPQEYESFSGIKVDDFEANMGLSSHEMFHSYMPFLMGINEKKYAWMDEGFANFFAEFLDYTHDQALKEDYLFLSDKFLVPIMVPSSLGSVSVNSYDVGAASYQALYSLLGKDLFMRCLKDYMTRWQYKHPSPYDFMNTFNTASGQDLTWFWKNWYFDWGYLDLGITDFSNGEITVTNEGGKAMGCKVVIQLRNGQELVHEVKPDVWKTGNIYRFNVENSMPVKSIQIKSPLTKWTDAIRSNDKWEVK